MFVLACRIVLVCFTLQSIWPAGVELPWKLHLSLGPRAAWGQPPNACLESDPLLAPTADADCSDPFITELAASLGHDAGAIFGFVRDEISYESYLGSLRGARGALWSRAGNALDQASLLVALLRASGISARYARGELSNAEARILVASMFPAPTRVSGFLPAGVTPADPENDAALLQETRDHDWVQLDTGGGFVDADPSFGDAQLGDTFAAETETYVEVADSRRHHATLRVLVERAQPFAGFLGASVLGETNVLDGTFTSAELVGRPLSLTHSVSNNAIPHPIFSAFTNVYTPQLVLGDLAVRPEDALTLLGTTFQETATNFPFGSSVLTAVTVEIELDGPDGPPETHRHVIFDRIGIDLRQNGGTPELNFSIDAPPILTDFDMVTVYLAPSLQPVDPLDRLRQDLVETESELALVSDEIEDRPPTPVDVGSLRVGLVNVAVAMAAGYLVGSDAFLAQDSAAALVRAYPDRPRIVIASTRVEAEGDPLVAKFMRGLDLRRDHLRVVPFPTQADTAGLSFASTRGLAETIIERNILSASFFPDDGLPLGASATILEEAVCTGVGFVGIGPANLGELDTLDISAEAKARIALAVSAGRSAFVPRASVDLGDGPVSSWLEIDPSTGHLIGVTEDGKHAGIIDTIAGGIIVLAVVGILAYLVWTYIWVPGVKKTQEWAGVLGTAIGNAFNSVVEWIKSFGFNPIPTGGGPGTGAAAAARVATIAACPDLRNNALFTDPLERWLDRALFLPEDPPVGELLVVRDPSGAFGGLGGGSVAVDLVPDPDLVVPVGGADLPTAFLFGVRSSVASEDTFSIDVTSAPPGFSVVTSLAEVTLAPGELGEIGVYLIPTGALPPPATIASFTIEATSQSSPAVSASATEDFVVPEIHAVALRAEPTGVRTTPGASAAVDLIVESVGNVPENVSFTSALSAGLDLAGLAPVVLAPGASATLPLTLTPDAATPIPAELTALVSGSFATDQEAAVSIPVRTAVPGADAIGNAAVALVALGDEALAARMADLETALAELFQNPTNPVFLGQALAALEAIEALLAGDPLLEGLLDDVAAARAALVAATNAAEVQAAIDALGHALGPVGDRLLVLSRTNFEIALNPTTRTAQPLAPVDFDVHLRNIGTETTTYDLFVSGLPPDVTSAFSQSSVTLAPGELAAGLVLTLTPTATDELLAAAFEVQAHPSAAPEIVKRAAGTLQARQAFVSVVSVDPVPPFADAGDPVAVSARLLNAVNRAREAFGSYRVLDPSGSEIAASAPVPVDLTVVSSLDTVDLGPLDTTGFGLGAHRIVVDLVDSGGIPIPGASGEGTLLIGSPVTASLSVAPDVLPPGDGTVTSRLSIETGATFSDPFTLIGQAPVAGASGLAMKGTLIYVCGSSGITIVDASTPAAPVTIKTVGAGAVNCAVRGDTLVTLTVGPPVIARVYSLVDPLNPLLLGSTSINYKFAGDVVLTDTAAFFTTILFCFFTGSQDIFTHHGDLFSVDVSVPGSPSLLDVLFDTFGTVSSGDETPGCGENGSGFNFFAVEQAGPNTLLAATTTVTGTNTDAGVGRILVVDSTDPADLQIVNELQFPGTAHVLGLGVTDDQAVVVASTGGWDDFATGGNLGLTGSMVVATVDLSDPLAPTIVQTRTLGRRSIGTGLAEPTGDGRYVSSSLGVDGDPHIISLIDARDPQNFIVGTTETPEHVLRAVATPTHAYTVSAAGLLVYDIGPVTGVPVTANVPIPTGSGVVPVPASFSVPPTAVIPGADRETYVWDLVLGPGLTSPSITWDSTLSGMEPGEARDTTLESTVEFFVGATAGEIPLPPLVVSSEQILSIAPSTRAAAPGASVSYTLTVANPTTVPVGYDLAVAGVPASWVDLEPAVVVPALGAVDVPLTLTSSPFAPLAPFDFTVTALNGTGGAVGAELVLEGAPVLPPPGDGVSRGVVVQIVPDRVAAGRGTPAFFQLHVTNTGSRASTFDLAVEPPPGFSSSLASALVAVPPGAGSFREVLLTLTPPDGASVADVPFRVVATATDDADVTGDATGVVEVLAFGVDVEIAPLAGAPGDTFDVTVTNTGSLPDSFHVSLAGPASLDATPATFDVGPLAPGASLLTPVSLGGLHDVLAGTLDLTVVAHSDGDSRVFDSASAAIVISNRRSLVVRCSPVEKVLPDLGSADFAIEIENLGAQFETYQARIVGETGPVDASLLGLDGSPVALVPLVLVPPLGLGEIGLAADLTDYGDASVTIDIDATTITTPIEPVTAVVTCRLSSDAENVSPLVDAGPNRPMEDGGTVVVDAVFTDADVEDTHTAMIDWGDGSDPVPGTVAQGSGSGTVSGSHAYAGPGPYTVTVCVSDQAGAEGCDEFVVGLVDHFMFYQSRLVPRSEKFFPIGPVTLSDRFGSDEYRVWARRSGRWLGVPANKNDEGIFDDSTHLEEYRLYAFHQSFAFERTQHVRAANQCGEVVLDVRRPYSLLVPTALDPQALVAPPLEQDHLVDHYLCYRAIAQKRGEDGARLARLPKGIQVEVHDPIQTRRYDLKRVTKLCTPVEKSGQPLVLSGGAQGEPFSLEPAGIRNPESPLVCYRATPAKRHIEQEGCGPLVPNDRGTRIDPKQPKHDPVESLFLANQLEAGQVDTVQEKELCIPSELIADRPILK